MNKENILWKLDLLEAKHLNAKPRLPKTKTLLNAKHKKKLPLLDLNRNDAISQIDDLKSQLCQRKVHSSLLKLNRLLKKLITLEKNKVSLKLKTHSEDTKLSHELDALNSLDVELISHSKLIKLMLKVYKINSRDVESLPKFLPTWCVETITNNEDKYNPKFQFKNNTQVQNNTISKISNHKDFKTLVEEIEYSLKIILGPVERKNKLDIEDSDESEVDIADEKVDSESDSEQDESSAEESADDQMDEEDIDIDAYKGMLVGSDEEEEDEDAFQLDPNIDYTAITDEEPSDDDDESDDGEDDSEPNSYTKLKLEKRKLENDDFFDFEAAEKKKVKKEKKSTLPALQGGYFSGSESDSDIDDDKVVKAATSQRKNRRGQRARQKIWELKYGSGAKHVQKEKVRVKSEREQRQKEYEERVKKREEKLRLLMEKGGTGSNQTPLSRERTHKPGSRHVAEPQVEKPLHPSWEAKLKAQELSKQKFAGKKIVFD